MGTVDALVGQRPYIDTNVFIYALENTPDWRDIAKQILGMVDSGQCHAVTSELVLGECLVRPFKLGRDDIVEAYLGAIQPRRFLAVLPVGRAILIQAAKLRATTSLKLPDAIQAATALVHGCEPFVTNDDGYRSVPGLRVITLRELAGS
jgi:predicted nucleic acid-binding protein